MNGHWILIHILHVPRISWLLALSMVLSLLAIEAEINKITNYRYGIVRYIELADTLALET